MLANWEAEKDSLVQNYRHLKVNDLRKRLQTAWESTRRTDLEIESVKQMRKNEVVKHLFNYFEINIMIEKQNKVLLGK